MKCEKVKEQEYSDSFVHEIMIFVQIAQSFLEKSHLYKWKQRLPLPLRITLAKLHTLPAPASKSAMYIALLNYFGLWIGWLLAYMMTVVEFHSMTSEIQ